MCVINLSYNDRNWAYSTIKKKTQKILPISTIRAGGGVAISLWLLKWTRITHYLHNDDRWSSECQRAKRNMLLLCSFSSIYETRGFSQRIQFSFNILFRARQHLIRSQYKDDNIISGQWPPGFALYIMCIAYCNRIAMQN